MPIGISDICDYNTLYSAYNRLKDEGDHTTSAKNSKAVFGQNIDIDGDNSVELWEFMQKANEAQNRTIFNEIKALQVVQNGKYPEISDDNPISIILSVESEITGKEKTGAAYAVINGIIQAAKEIITDEMGPVEKLQTLQGIIRNDFNIKPKDGLFQLSEELAKDRKAANCVLFSYLYIAVAHEMSWPILYASSERHAFIYCKIDESKYIGFFETTKDGGVGAKTRELIKREEKYAFNNDINRLIAETFNNRGLAYYLADRNDKAIDDFGKAIDLKGDDPDLYNNRGAAYDEEGNHDKAIIDYTKAIELSGVDPTFFNNRGDAYYELGKYGLAEKDWEMARQLSKE
jgi:tetratricopeptide (TPR) repeat protein